jgi:stage II sporulation protein P
MNNPVVSTGKINIINQTKYSIDIKKLLNEPLKLAANKKGPQVLVYHTHTTEGFLKNIDELTKTNLASRTSNNKYNVVSVGDALINNLKKYKIDVLHNTTVHDADYNSSYTKSLKTLTNYVNKYSSLNMIIDLHRDAISEGKLRVVKKINGKNVAQIMFVVGTDSKLSNPYWKENLKLAIKIQSRLNEICPGIAKPIYISQKRYNQQLKSGSVIIEVGGDGNVIDECVRSTTYLAQAINDVLYKNK